MRKCLNIDKGCHTCLGLLVLTLQLLTTFSPFLSRSNNLCMSNTLTHNMSVAINAPLLAFYRLQEDSRSAHTSPGNML